MEKKSCSLAKILTLSFLLALALTLSAFAAEGVSVVYLADGGAGDGSGAESAVPTLEDAYAALDLSLDCTVVVSGAFTQSADFVLGEDYSGSVTFTSVYGGVDYRESGACYQFPSVKFACYGETAFENMNFVSLDTGFVVVGQHNPVTLGEGLTMLGDGMVGGSIAKSFAVFGGYDKNIGISSLSDSADTSVTVLSGSKIYILPYSRQLLGTYSGTANIHIGGSASVSVLHGSAAYPSGVTVGDVRVTLADGASVSAFYGCTQNTDMNSFELRLESGTISNFNWSTGASYKLNIAEKTVLRASDKAAASRSFASLAANFDTTVVSATVADDVVTAQPAPGEEVLLATIGAVADYNAVRFESVGAQLAQASLLLPNGASRGYAYLISDGELSEIAADDVGNGHIAFDLTSAGTYLCAEASLLHECDIDGDYRVGVRDVLLALRAFLVAPSEAQFAIIDMNGDGEITLTDILAFLRAIAGTSAPVKEEPIVPENYNVISVEEYLDRTKLGLLSQFVGFLSGYEFAKNPDGEYICMPEEWFELCNGPYAGNTAYAENQDKLLYNEESGIWEVWNDDDFSIDILNQFILTDMYEDYGTFASKSITDAWVNYNVYDMGGGNRDLGAYALMKRYGYLSVFAGNTEFGNNFNVNGEPYIGNETLGMNAPGMPDLAVSLAHSFGSATSDRDPLNWLKFFASMYSLAYFESDIPTLIGEARKVLPDGCWQHKVIDTVLALHEKYPDDWRSAVREANDVCMSAHYDSKSTVGETSVNCSMILIGLLYGGGDYYETCKIISLAGHGGDSTTPVGLGVVGVICGWDGLDAETKAVINEKVWQDGKGVVVNLPADSTTSYGTWMYCAGLPERFNMSDILDMYQANFESLLLENGGRVADGNYYIPKNDMPDVETLYAESFETSGIGGFTAEGGTVTLADVPFMGAGSVQVNAADSGESAAYTTVSGLTVGSTYKLTAFVRTTEGVTAHMFARSGDTESFVTVSDPGAYVVRYTVGVGANDVRSYVRRELVFTAAAESVQIGLRLPSGTPAGGNASFDEVSLVRVEETMLGDFDVGGEYTGKLRANVVCDSEREVLLKLTYTNSAKTLVRAALELNRVWHTAVPLVPTTAKGKVTVYVPVLLDESDNTVSLYLGEAPIEIHEMEIVTLKERF